MSEGVRQQQQQAPPHHEADPSTRKTGTGDWANYQPPSAVLAQIAQQQKQQQQHHQQQEQLPPPPPFPFHTQQQPPLQPQQQLPPPPPLHEAAIGMDGPGGRGGARALPGPPPRPLVFAPQARPLALLVW